MAKEYNTQPTNKQKVALEKIVENHGNISKSMREAGYSENSAKNPKNLTDSKGFQQLAEAYLPDDMLLRALAEDIEEKKQNRKPELELAFKVKGQMTEKKEVDMKQPMMVIPDSIYNNVMSELEEDNK